MVHDEKMAVVAAAVTDHQRAVVELPAQIEAQW
jgi:hypothetical protein